MELKNLKERHEKEVNEILSKQKEESLHKNEKVDPVREWKIDHLLHTDNPSRCDFFTEKPELRPYPLRNKETDSLKSSLEVTNMFRSPLLTNRCVFLTFSA